MRLILLLTILLISDPALATHIQDEYFIIPEFIYGSIGKLTFSEMVFDLGDKYVRKDNKDSFTVTWKDWDIGHDTFIGSPGKKSTKWHLTFDKKTEKLIWVAESY